MSSVHSKSRWASETYMDALEWKRFRRNVVLAAIGTYVGYSLLSAKFLDGKFDQEFCTEDFKKRVLKIGVKKEPPAGAVKVLTQDEKDKIRLREPDPNVRNYKGSNTFDAIRARAFVPDKVDTALLDGFQRPVLTVSTALYLESQRSPASFWDDTASTLNPGDIILMKGTGKMSWRIANLTYPWTNFDPWALKYTHVSVVVDVDRTKDPADVWILEAVDNSDASVPSRDGVVRHRQVQVVNARDRLFSLRPDDKLGRFENSILGKIAYTFFLPPPSEEYKIWKTRCYSRASCRRLEGFEWTPERRASLKNFVDKNVGRPIDRSPLVSVAQLGPEYYTRKNPEEITCTELLVDLYKELGAAVNEEEFKRRQTEATKYDVDLETLKHLWKVSYTYIPYHFTPKGERSYPISWTSRFTHLGPEEKLLMNW